MSEFETPKLRIKLTDAFVENGRITGEIDADTSRKIRDGMFSKLSGRYSVTSSKIISWAGDILEDDNMIYVVQNWIKK